MSVATERAAAVVSAEVDPANVNAPTRTDRLLHYCSGWLGGPAGRRMLSPRVTRVLMFLFIGCFLVMALGVIQKQPCRTSGWVNPDQYVHACYSDIAVLYSNNLGVTERPSLPTAAAPWAKERPSSMNQTPLLAAAMWLTSGQVAVSWLMLLAGALLLAVAGIAMRVVWGAARGIPLSLGKVAGIATIVLGLVVVLAVLVARQSHSGASPQRLGVDPSSTHAIRDYFDVSTLLMLVLLLLAVLATAWAAGHQRRWDAAHLAFAPIIVTAGLVSYELLVVALVAGALMLWSRTDTHPGYALGCGVLLGLAAAGQPAAGLIVVAIVAVAYRAGQTAAGGYTAGAAILSWYVIRALILQDPTAGILGAWSSWFAKDPSYGSLWQTPGLAKIGGFVMGQDVASWLQLLTLGVGVGAVVFWVFALHYRPRLAHVALIVVVLGIVVDKSVPPQASLLVLPLLALSGLKWRDHLIWASAEIAYFIAVWYHIKYNLDAAEGASLRGLPPEGYAVFTLIRLAALGWLASQAVRLARHPEQDPVRVPVEGEGVASLDDPSGGCLAGRPDALTFRVS